MTGQYPFSTVGAGRVHLRILETTDLHAHVLPYDYYADRPDDSFGLSRAAPLIQRARTEAANALLFDNGDFLQGNPMGDYIALERGLQSGVPHPVIAAMNALGYDAATPGNHDLNYGLDYLLACVADAGFPVTSANLTTMDEPDTRRTILAPYVLLDRALRDGAGATHPIRIGVIGFLPPQTAIWDRRHLSGRAGTRDIVEAARAWVPKMRAAGADIVIALCHSGIGAADHSTGMENAAVPLAGLPGIDALLLGHSHQVFPDPAFAGRAGIDPDRGTISGKPAVMAGFWGSHVGQIDLLMGHEGGRWRVLDHQSAAHATPPPAKGARPPPLKRPQRLNRAASGMTQPVIDAARADHEGTLRYIRRRIGRSEVALNSFFALVADSPAVRIVAEAQAAHVSTRIKGGRFDGLPVISAAAPFKTGGRGGSANYTDIPAGDLTLGHVSDLYPFPNTICALRLTGAQVSDWLERAAALFCRIAPGSADAPLLTPDCPGYNFDTLYGLTYRIDLGQPPRFNMNGTLADPHACRIKDLCHRGQPVRPDQVFILATNSYRGLGGGDFPGTTGDNVVLEGPETNREVILNHLKVLATVTAPADPTWRFHPMPGTSVLFETSPRACNQPATPCAPAFDLVGQGDRGFATFRLRL